MQILSAAAESGTTITYEIQKMLFKKSFSFWWFLFVLNLNNINFAETIN